MKSLALVLPVAAAVRTSQQNFDLADVGSMISNLALVALNKKEHEDPMIAHEEMLQLNTEPLSVASMKGKMNDGDFDDLMQETFSV